MPTNGSCLKVITSGSSIRKVKKMTSITPSKDAFLLLLYYTSAGLDRIRSSNVRSARPPEKHYPPFRRSARILSNGYYILKVKNMRWWLQKSSMILMVGLIGLTGSFGLKNKWIRCILYPLEQELDWRIQCGRMLPPAASIAYGL